MTNDEGAITGRIADRPVADLFQWLHESRSTGVARFRTALGTATVWIRDGELIDADMGRFHMDAAVLRLMRIQDGEYEVERKPVQRRRTIKPSTPQLLAEGRQRAPRPGSSVGPSMGPSAGSGLGRPSTQQSRSASRPQVKPGSGEYSHKGSGLRDDSRAHRSPTPAEPSRAAPSAAPARIERAADSGAHTLLDAKAVPRPPAAGTGAQTVIGPRSSAAADARSRGERRRGMGWSPTAGGLGQAPEPTPSTRSAAVVPGRPGVEPGPPAPRPEPDALLGHLDHHDHHDMDDVAEHPGNDDLGPPRGRTQFMFGVSGPGAASQRPSTEPAPAAAPVPPVLSAPVPSAVPLPVAPSVSKVPARALHPAAETLPSPESLASLDAPRRDSLRSPSDPRRRRAATRPQVPFEPERADRTLLRAGPLPPPPGQPVMLPSSPSQAIPLAGPAPAPYREPSRATLRPHGMGEPAAAPMTPPFAGVVPQLINEEYSHPISVPTAPSVGPGGTWMLHGPGPADPDRPLPPDPTAEDTVSMRAPELRAVDVVQPRAPTLSSHVRAASGTAHVGRYEVLLRLARGGMGTVYLCRVTGEGGFRRLFALKVIRDHLNTNHAYVQMLLEEARIASRLSHPNIVSIIDIDTFAGQHYLVMEYVEGCTLSELLKAHPKSRPPELIVPIVVDALTGLHAAHGMRGDDGSPQPVVHCDFSPQNMLVGVNGTCRITDFGVSKAANALPDGPGRGKPGYLSPEQVRGLPLDARSDVFSAGVVLWNALTGETLFDGETPQQILHQVVSRSIPKPSSVGLRPPACFDRICLKALERDPAKRYQSAEQMLMELRKVAIAQDLLAPSSEVGLWVQDTFGAQIELRRQTAGLGPGPTAAALALRDVGGLGGASGHSEGARDGSITGHDANASMTMMLRAGAVRPDEVDEEREGLGPRTRMLVIVGALAFMGAAVITLFVRPDLLQGGIIDETGRYIDLDDPPPEPRTNDGTTGGPAAVAGDESTGSPALDSEAETDGEADGGTTTDPDVEPEPEPDSKGKRSRVRVKDTPAAKAPATGDTTQPTKGTKGGKRKDKGGSAAPPPDLDELFRPPGG